MCGAPTQSDRGSAETSAQAKELSVLSFVWSSYETGGVLRADFGGFWFLDCGVLA
jgi:hypothetical protein